MSARHPVEAIAINTTNDKIIIVVDGVRINPPPILARPTS